MGKINARVFTALFISIFAAVTGVGIVVPLLPVYAHDLGASGLYIALIFGGFSLSRTVFLPWFCRISDRRGRKPVLTLGLFCYFLISIAFIFSYDIKSLIMIRIVQGIGSAMVMPVAQAYIGDITPTGKEGISMGMFNMSVFLGLSIGPLLGGSIKDYYSLDAAFGCMGALAFGAFCLSLFFLPPAREERIVVAGYRHVPWRRLLLDRGVISIFSFRFVYVTCIGVIWGFLPVFGDTAFSLPSASIGFLVMLGVAVGGMMHLPMGAVADRMDKRVLVITGGLITTTALMLIGSAEGFWDLFFANLIFGIGGGMSMPSLMAISVMIGHRTQAMGAVMALVTVAHSLGMFFGSMIGGIIMDAFQLRYAFPIGALFMASGTLIFFSGTCTKTAWNSMIMADSAFQRK